MADKLARLTSRDMSHRTGVQDHQVSSLTGPNDTVPVASKNTSKMLSLPDIQATTE
tara:strand:- start:7763 stop:7930 length:168 start_codon:yes stop_codon:yes gene_type:complete